MFDKLPLLIAECLIVIGYLVFSTFTVLLVIQAEIQDKEDIKNLDFIGRLLYRHGVLWIFIALTAFTAILIKYIIL